LREGRPALAAVEKTAVQTFTKPDEDDDDDDDVGG